MRTLARRSKGQSESYIPIQFMEQPIPTAPSEEILGDKRRGSNIVKSKEYHLLLEQLFSKTQMLSRHHFNVLDEFKDGAYLLRALLPSYAYKFGSGPWRNLWIRYGYDPTVDPLARYFQSIIIKFHHKELQAIQDKVSLSLTKTHAHCLSLSFFLSLSSPRYGANLVKLMATILLICRLGTSTRSPRFLTRAGPAAWTSPYSACN